MLKRIALVFLLLAVSVGVSEALARLIFPPVDYLEVTTVSDPILGHRIRAGDNGHDAWGRRSANGPEVSDILAIGDSMTYGYGVRGGDAWPMQLGDLAGLKVYNAGLGGYGPLQYLTVLKTRFDDIAPKGVVLMVFPGNDLFDAYNIAYNKEYWASWRQSDQPQLAAPVVEPQDIPQPSKVKRLRSWLAGNSIIYRVVTQSPVFDVVRRSEAGGAADVFTVDHAGATSILSSKRWMFLTDLERPRINEGLRITKRALGEIADYLSEREIPLHVMIMPVREHVFMSSSIKGDFRDDAEMQYLAQNLEKIEKDLEGFLDEKGVAFTNLRPVFTQALETQNLFPVYDSHPTAVGYDLIAREILPVARAMVAGN